MPSYQEQLNNEQNQYYGNYTWYVQQFQQYSQEASVEAAKAQNLTYVTIGISIMAVLISYYAIAKEERFTRKSGLLYIVLGALIGLMAVIIFPDYFLLILVIFCLFGGFMIYKVRSIKKREERDLDMVQQYQT